MAIHLAGNSLRIAGWPGVEQVALGSLRLPRRSDSWLLTWESATSVRSGQCALHLDRLALAKKVGVGDTALEQYLLAHLPTDVASGPERRATQGWLWVTLGLLVGLPLLIAAAIIVYRAEIIDAAVSRIPVAQEKTLSEHLWRLQSSQIRLIEGREINPIVETLGKRLIAAKQSVYDYRWYVVDDRSVNAFAMPGGIVAVHRGLILKTASAEELAAVLAHEIEHVERRHSLRAMVQGLGISAVWLVLTGDLGAGVAADAMRQLAGLHFSRMQESEADRGGVERLHAAGIDARGMASFFATLAAQQAELPKGLSLLSTHPASSQRAQDVNDLLKSAPPRAPMEYDWKSVKKSLDTLAGP